MDKRIYIPKEIDHVLIKKAIRPYHIFFLGETEDFKNKLPKNIIEKSDENLLLYAYTDYEKQKNGLYLIDKPFALSMSENNIDNLANMMQTYYDNLKKAKLTMQGTEQINFSPRNNEKHNHAVEIITNRRTNGQKNKIILLNNSEFISLFDLVNQYIQ